MPLTLEIVTPEGCVYKDTVENVVLPTTSGEVGILPGHIPLMTQTMAGELRVMKGAEEVRLIIGEGFAQVDSDKISVIAEHAIDEAKIDAGSVEEAMRLAQEKLQNAAKADEQEIARTERMVRFLEAQLRRKRRGA